MTGLCDESFDSTDERHQPTNDCERRQAVFSESLHNLVSLKEDVSERLVSIKNFQADVANPFVDGQNTEQAAFTVNMDVVRIASR